MVFITFAVPSTNLGDTGVLSGPNSPFPFK